MNKSILIGFIILLMCTTIIHGELTGTTIQIKNESVQIQPQIENEFFCNQSINTVFLIKRINKTNQSLYINYSMSVSNQTVTLQTNISKQIHSFTKTNTGNIPLLNVGNYTLSWKYKEQELYWNFSCKLTNTTINTTTNNTIIPLENITSNESNTGSSNNTINSSTNNTINSTLNNTINSSTNNTINNTIQHPLTNITTTPKNTTTNSSLEEDQDCLTDFSIQTNKQLFEEGEQIRFSFKQKPEKNLEVEYWIEDLNGNIIKKPYTSNSTSTKTYTFKKINEKDKAYLVKGKVEDNCKKIILSKLVVVQNKQEEKEEKNNISIKELKQEKNELTAIITIQKINTNKKVVEAWFENEQKEKISSIQKINIQSNNENIIWTTKWDFTNLENKTITFVVTGLDLYKQKDFKFQEQKVTPQQQRITFSAYTRQTYLDQKIFWYVNTEKNSSVRVFLIQEANIEENNTIKKFKINTTQNNPTILTLVQKDNSINYSIDQIHLESKMKKNKENSTLKQEKIEHTKEVLTKIQGQTIQEPIISTKEEEKNKLFIIISSISILGSIVFFAKKYMSTQAQKHT